VGTGLGGIPVHTGVDRFVEVQDDVVGLVVVARVVREADVSPADDGLYPDIEDSDRLELEDEGSGTELSPFPWLLLL
jgi:hypothetical protein